MMLASLPVAQTPAPAEYLGLFAGGQRIGYSRFTSADDTYKGEAATRQDSVTKMKLALQGTPLEVSIDSTTYTVAGKVREIRFVQRSGGRTSGCNAVFGEGKVAVEMTSDSGSTTRDVPYPDGLVVDDPLAYLMAHPGGAKAQAFWILDPSTGAFVRNVARVMGPASVTVGPLTTKATRVDIEDPRMTTTCYLSGKGDLIKATTPLGIDSLPITEAEALAPLGEGTNLDLASATSLVPDRALKDPEGLSHLRLKITGISLPSVPSGDHQSAKAVPGGWLVDVHPKALGKIAPVTIAQARAQKPDWIKDDSYLPASDPAMVAEARRIVGAETDVLRASEKIRLSVYRRMTPNAGIGILRDAREVLASKEGVCRDYAILTATLLRAAGIPTRLATGLVTWDGTFYYHAWCEVWSGAAWTGIDAAAPSAQISAGHVKLSEGGVDRAFTFPVLGRAKVAVLAQESMKESVKR